MIWLRRALGIATEHRKDEFASEHQSHSEHDEFPDDPTTDTVPKAGHGDAEFD